MGKIFEEGVAIGITSLKGGVGKSILTSMLANYIHNNMKYFKVLVCDCDDFQTTLVDMRESDLLKNENIDKSALYDLINVQSRDLPNNIESYKSLYDLIFIDLPGNLMQPGVIECYTLTDIMFIPAQASDPDIRSSLKFYKLITEEINPLRVNNGFPGIECFGFFNRVDVNNVDFKDLYAYKDDFPYPYLESFIPDSKVTFQRNISTIDTYTNSRYNEYNDFCEEVMEKILNYKENN